MKEAVHDSSLEDYRVRRLVLKLFLEDGTMQIIEPPSTNSGMPHGPFVNRHQFLKDDGNVLEFRDIKCGMNLNVYSRVIRITAMDDYTKAFYKSHALDTGIEEDIPEDAFAVKTRKDIEDLHRPLPLDVIREKALVNVLCGGTDLNRKVSQYIKNSGKVLRFYASWKDESEDGYMHEFHIHFFIADDTVEIVETTDNTRSLFFKRSMISKHGIGPTISDKYDERNHDILTPKDLYVGAKIELGGRILEIFNCDPFTRQYYETELGIRLCDALQHRPITSENILSPQALPIPPHNGFGSEEDSLNSCCVKSLVPKHRVKMYSENEDVILRFEAVIDNGNRNDSMRKFVLSFFPSDDTLSVFEHSVRNSGIIGGKFAERARRKKENGEFYTLRDLYVNSVVRVSGQPFRITLCDKYTQNYLTRTCRHSSL
jgi:hypothetical protein